jgi:hypothetical protein
MQPPLRPHQLHSARQAQRPLTRPSTDEIIRSAKVSVGQLGHPSVQQPATQYPAAKRRRRPGKRSYIQDRDIGDTGDIQACFGIGLAQLRLWTPLSLRTPLSLWIPQCGCQQLTRLLLKYVEIFL